MVRVSSNSRTSFLPAFKSVQYQIEYLQPPSNFKIYSMTLSSTKTYEEVVH